MRQASLSFARRVTDVGAPVAVYNVETLGISSTIDVEVTVVPQRLECKKQNQTASYTVSVQGVALAANEVASVAIVWSDGYEKVSPLVVYTVGVEMPPVTIT